jgi:hypothetical protein
MFSLSLLKRPCLLRQVFPRKRRITFPTAVVNLPGRNEVLNDKYKLLCESRITEQEKLKIKFPGTVSVKMTNGRSLPKSKVTYCPECTEVLKDLPAEDLILCFHCKPWFHGSCTDCKEKVNLSAPHAYNNTCIK